MGKGGGSLGNGRKTLNELQPVPVASTLAQAERLVQAVLLDAVEDAGGRLGLPLSATAQVQLDDIDVVVDYAEAWVRSHAEEKERGLYYPGQPGLWHCLDDLVPLQDPNRWNTLRLALTRAFEDRGWERQGGVRGKAWLIPGAERAAAAFVLTYNPTTPSWTDDEYAADVQATSIGRTVRSRWSTGNRTSGIRTGDRAYLMRQVSDRGIVASGTFKSEVYFHEHWADAERESPYADVEWDCILDPEDRLPVEELVEASPGVPWNRLQSSGISVPGADVDVVAALWNGHIGQTPFSSPEEQGAQTFSEGRRTRVETNRYERDRKARAACINHYGAVCQVCALDFGDRYGEIGEGFIHVHHVVDVSLNDAEYVVDPVDDLQPVCPNCHAMLHRERPAMSVESLRRVLLGRPQ